MRLRQLGSCPRHLPRARHLPCARHLPRARHLPLPVSARRISRANVIASSSRLTKPDSLHFLALVTLARLASIAALANLV